MVTEGTTLEANLRTNDTTLDASLVIEGIALDASLVAKQSTVESTTSSDSRMKATVQGMNAADQRIKTEYADIGPSYDSNTLSEFKEPPKVPLKRRDVNLKKHLEQAQLSNYDLKLWKSLPMKYFCYVKHEMLKFEKETISKQKPPQEDVFINSSFKENVKRITRNRLSEEFEPLVKDVNLQLNCFGKSLDKEIKDDLKYVTSLEDECDETCLILDIQQEFFKTQFESVKLKSYGHVYENKIFKQNSSLENENHYLKMSITELSKQASDVK
ncbi:hypothetical protein Tco_0548400 [Tanacetum coccineum]